MACFKNKKMSDTNAAEPEIGKLRKIFYPIHLFEVKKILPMGIIFFFILFNYICLCDVKEVMIVNAPNSGAEVISFLEFYFSSLMLSYLHLLYAKGSDLISNEKLFYVIISSFDIFFVLIGFVIYFRDGAYIH